MILALALAALNQDKRQGSGQMFLTRDNMPAKSASYAHILRVLMRRNKGSSEINGNTEEVIVAPVSSPAATHDVPGSGTLPGSSVASAFSSQLAAGGKVPAASRTTPEGGQRIGCGRRPTLPGERA